jgi:hypothetical protein
MLNQFEDMIINQFVSKLQEHGLSLDATTVKQAISNSPQIVQQIEAILIDSSSQDKLAKITGLLSQAAGKSSGTPPAGQGK